MRAAESGVPRRWRRDRAAMMEPAASVCTRPGLKARSLRPSRRGPGSISGFPQPGCSLLEREGVCGVA